MNKTYNISVIMNQNHVLKIKLLYQLSTAFMFDGIEMKLSLYACFFAEIFQSFVPQ